MFTSSTILVALTGLIATATAIDPPPPSTELAEEDRRLLKKTEAEKAERASLFEKLGFCNGRTLRGRYTFAANGFADVSGVFVSDTFPPVAASQLSVGPVASSGVTFFDGKGKSFTQFVSRPDKFASALGPPAVINFWADVDIAKNCSILLSGTVIEYISPLELILPGDTFFIEGNVAPDGSNNVFTQYETSRIQAISGEAKQVAKFALPPQQLKDGPPSVPTSCDASQSCIQRYLGASCQNDFECRIFCFPFCDMFCGFVGIGIRKQCISLPVSDDK